VSGTAGSALRVPVYSAPRPASQMNEAHSVNLKTNGSTASGSLKLNGYGFAFGSGTDAEQSVVSGFEEEGTSPQMPDCTATIVTNCIPFPDERAADLKRVGVTSDGSAAYFAVNTWGTWRTPASYVEFDIYIDSNSDGTPDYVLFNSRLSGTDIFVSELYNLAAGSIDDIELLNIADGSFDTDIFNSDTMVLPVSLAALGLTPGNTRFQYQVQSGTIYGTTDSIGTWMSYDPAHPGALLTLGGQNDVLYPDRSGENFTVVADPAALAADHVNTLMMVHYLNRAGDRVQDVALSVKH
jgi:hypothetical protein